MNLLKSGLAASRRVSALQRRKLAYPSINHLNATFFLIQIRSRTHVLLKVQQTMTMADPAVADMEDELVDYEEEDVAEEVPEAAADGGKKGYVGIHSVGFKDFQLKPELVRAIQDCGFEHPSESAFGSPCVASLP